MFTSWASSSKDKSPASPGQAADPPRELMEVLSQLIDDKLGRILPEVRSTVAQALAEHHGGPPTPGTPSSSSAAGPATVSEVERVNLIRKLQASQDEAQRLQRDLVAAREELHASKNEHLETIQAMRALSVSVEGDNTGLSRRNQELAEENQYLRAEMESLRRAVAEERAELHQRAAIAEEEARTANDRASADLSSVLVSVRDAFSWIMAAGNSLFGPAVRSPTASLHVRLFASLVRQGSPAVLRAAALGLRLDPNAYNEKETPLLVAIESGASVAVIRTLLDLGADPNFTLEEGAAGGGRGQYRVQGALMEAAKKRRMDAVRALLEHGAARPTFIRVQAPYPNATFCEELCWGAREDVVPLVKAILEAFPRQGLTLRESASRICATERAEDAVRLAIKETGQRGSGGVSAAAAAAASSGGGGAAPPSPIASSSLGSVGSNPRTPKTPKTPLSTKSTGRTPSGQGGIGTGIGGGSFGPGWTPKAQGGTPSSGGKPGSGVTSPRGAALGSSQGRGGTGTGSRGVTPTRLRGRGDSYQDLAENASPPGPEAEPRTPKAAPLSEPAAPSSPVDGLRVAGLAEPPGGVSRAQSSMGASGPGEAGASPPAALPSLELMPGPGGPGEAEGSEVGVVRVFRYPGSPRGGGSSSAVQA